MARQRKAKTNRMPDRLGAVRKGVLPKTRSSGPEPKIKTIRRTYPEMAKIADNIAQSIANAFPDCACGKLMAAVVANAVADLVGQSNTDRESALAYLTGTEIYHAELAGIDTDWIQTMLVKSGLLGFAQSLKASSIAAKFRGVAHG